MSTLSKRNKRRSLLAAALLISPAVAGAAIPHHAGYSTACLAGIPTLLIVPPPAQTAGTLALPTVDARGNLLNVTETVTVSARRIPCSTVDSVVLLELDEDSFGWYFEPFWRYPDVRLAQKNHTDVRALVAGAGNTQVVLPGTPFDTSKVFALREDSGVDLQQAFQIVVFGANGSKLNIDMPAYAPTPQTTPDAYSALRLQGSLSGNYFDPSHSGEGMIVEVGSRPDGSQYVQTAWFAYAPSGRPFWIFGGADFAPGAREIDIPLIYGVSGSFAGQGSTAQQRSWGTLHAAFTTCNMINFSFSSNAGLPAEVPQGSGQREWSRLTPLDSLPCD